MTATRAIISSVLAVLPAMATALELEFPAAASLTGERVRPDAGYMLPVSPVSDGVLEHLQLSGTSESKSFRFPLNGLTTADIMSDLRVQAQKVGFTTLLDCAARTCGGFDFRYELNLLPEPKMHVDLGDFRFLSGVRRTSDGDTEHLQLVVSRSPANAYVHVTTISDMPRAVTVVAATKTPEPVNLDKADLFAADLSETLLSTGHAVLDGLEFQTGSSQLTDGTDAIIGDLAAFLRANPDLTVALVGHTDAEGGLSGNMALSKRRAETVMNQLRRDYGIPAAVLEAQGVGYLAPVASNATEEGRQKNRRVEVVITSTR